MYEIREWQINMEGGAKPWNINKVPVVKAKILTHKTSGRQKLFLRTCAGHIRDL